MNNKRLIFLTIGFFLIFLMASIPAKIAYSILPKTKGLEVSSINGTIWSGKAENVRYNGIDFGKTHWKLSPLSLFLLSINGEIHSKNESSKIDANISLSFSGFESDSIKAQLPANWIPKLSNSKFNTEGRIILRIISMEQSENKPLTLIGSVAWQQAAIKPPFGSRAALGDLQINVSSEKENLLFDISDNRGPLDIDAKIKFTPPNKIIARGSVNQELPVELANFFSFFAKPDNKGKLIFDYTTTIPGM